MLPWSLQKAYSPADTLILAQYVPFQMSDLQNYKILNLCVLNHEVGGIQYSSNRKLIIVAEQAV